jgi:hypothetical protein
VGQDAPCSVARSSALAISSDGLMPSVAASLATVATVGRRSALDPAEIVAVDTALEAKALLGHTELIP